MKTRIRFLLYYFLFWLAYFITFRGIFLLYQFQESALLPSDLIFGVFYHGIKMDISFSAYLCVLVFLAIASTSLIPSPVILKGIRWYTLLVLIFISFISVADLELFKEWGFRLDATPLAYLSTPREMAVSAASSPFVLLITSIVFIAAGSYLMYIKKVHVLLAKIPKINPAFSLLFLAITASLVIPIRGGFQLAPLNQSAAFFSKNDFANQAALNVPWNFFRSITMEVHSTTNPYTTMPLVQAQTRVKNFYKSSGNRVSPLLKTERPNIIIVLWESLTAKALPILGGSYSHILPEFEALIPEGILFSDFYANGDRSDKGIVSILSGYPPQPKKSIVKIPTKSSKLPVITHAYNREGYYTAFFHGGELEFANIKSYLLHAGFHNIIGKEAFKLKDMNSKWGAHDHVVFERSLKEISQQKEPFFNIIFTLSSHEPFEIPVESKFPGDDLESLYLSSLHYTDQYLGAFIKAAKSQSWYQNTLIVVLADHGHRLLDNSNRFQKEKYKIPMLWLGGALALKDSIIQGSWSQTDLAKTLLKQSGLEHQEFTWSRDMFDPISQDGAFYAFNDGIGFVRGEEHLVYDHASSNILQRTSGIGPEDILLIKAHLQYAYQDYLNK